MTTPSRANTATDAPGESELTDAPTSLGASGNRSIMLNLMTITAAGLTTMTHIRGGPVELVLAGVGVLICRQLAATASADDAAGLANALTIGLLPLYIILGPRHPDPWELWGISLITLLVTRTYITTSKRLHRQ